MKFEVLRLSCYWSILGPLYLIGQGPRPNIYLACVSTIAPQNSYFPFPSEEKSGVLMLKKQISHVSPISAYESVISHVLWLFLTLRSPRYYIKCSKRCSVPHILRWEVDPTADICLRILSGITPTQFRLLYKTPKGLILFTLQYLQTLKNSQTLLTFKKFLQCHLFFFFFFFCKFSFS